MKTRVSLKYFMTGCSLKSDFDELDINELKMYQVGKTL